MLHVQPTAKSLLRTRTWKVTFLSMNESYRACTEICSPNIFHGQRTALTISHTCLFMQDWNDKACTTLSPCLGEISHGSNYNINDIDGQPYTPQFVTKAKAFAGTCLCSHGSWNTWLEEACLTVTEDLKKDRKRTFKQFATWVQHYIQVCVCVYLFVYRLRLWK